jgi:hypothetical protein
MKYRWIGNDQNGQAMVEALIVLPVLIMMFWGLYYMHAASFLSLKAQLAARHAAWVGSRKEYGAGDFLGGGVIDRTLAIERGMQILSGDGMWNRSHVLQGFDNLSTSGDNPRTNGFIFVDAKDWLALDEMVSNMLDQFFADLIGPGISGTIKTLAEGFTDFLNSFVSALPLGRCFTQNSFAQVSLNLKTPFFEGVHLEADAYFCNRWEDLYFLNLWDFFDLSAVSVIDGLKNTMEDVNKNIEDAVEQYQEMIDKYSDDIPDDQEMPYDYDDLARYLEKWKEITENWIF